MKKIVAALIVCLMMMLSVTTVFASVPSPERDRNILVTRDPAVRPDIKTAEDALSGDLSKVVPGLADPDNYTAVDIFETYTSDGSEISEEFTFTIHTSITPGTEFKLVRSLDGGKTFTLVSNATLDADGNLTVTDDALAIYSILVEKSSGSETYGTDKSSPQTGETTSASLILLCAFFVAAGCIFAVKSRRHA